MKKFLSSVAMAVAVAACSPQSVTPESSTSSSDAAAPAMAEIKSGVDYHSLSNPGEMKVTHLDLDLTADFDAKRLKGSVTLTFDKLAADASELVLDTRDLDIQSVSANGESLAFTLDEADPELGAALRIQVPEGINQVTVSYQTSPQASGVQWLTPAQTAGKQHPFLFTQAQAVHARSFIPLQDSPQVRVTYTAKIKTPEELLAVMSASNLRAAR